jgi:uncharacterized FlaG/YvyC family protein
MACEKKNTQKEKFGSFSETEIDVAKHLIQLSNSTGGSESSTTNSVENRHSNSSNSVTLQRKGSDEISPQPSSPADSVEDVLADIEEDERLRRKNKRFRYIEDLYRVTVPIVNTPHK